MITAIRPRVAVVVLALICFGVVAASVVYAQPPEQQGEFLPLDKLPPQEQLPAARLLVAAYSFVIFAVFMYVVSVARRLSAVQREVERLEADVKRSSRA